MPGGGAAESLFASSISRKPSDRSPDPRGRPPVPPGGGGDGGLVCSPPPGGTGGATHILLPTTILVGNKLPRMTSRPRSATDPGRLPFGWKGRCGRTTAGIWRIRETGISFRGVQVVAVCRPVENSLIRLTWSKPKTCGGNPRTKIEMGCRWVASLPAAPDKALTSGVWGVRADGWEGAGPGRRSQGVARRQQTANGGGWVPGSRRSVSPSGPPPPLTTPPPLPEWFYEHQSEERWGG